MLLLALALAALTPSARAEKKRAPAPAAIISVTVFRDPGFALADAKVTVSQVARPGTPEKKLKTWTAATGARGECVIPVPASSAGYKVRASMKGFQPAEKSVAAPANERVEVTLTLSPESNK